MKQIYLDCSFGAAGDMLSSALFDIIPDQTKALDLLNGMGIPGVVFEAEPAVRGVITGTHLKVLVHGEEETVPDHGHEHPGHDHHAHVHRSLKDIQDVVDHLNVSDSVRSHAGEVYRVIASAESQVHKEPVSEVHFHEVGAMDAVADVAAFSVLLEYLGEPEVWAGPVQTGSGTVMSAHGILPVPAPATSLILQGIPVFSDPEVKGELVTPTGAALLRHFVTHFGASPVMRLEKTGYGMGSKDYGPLDFVRACYGETVDLKNTEKNSFEGTVSMHTSGEEALSDDSASEAEEEDQKGYPVTGQSHLVLEISCNVDDMTAEEIAFAMARLFDAGAFEVYTVPVGMKKSRPGTLIKAMCDEQHKDAMIQTIFTYTSTIGLRITRTHSVTLKRQFTRIKTPYGNVVRKTSSGYGKTVRKYEFKDLSRMAKEQNVSLSRMRELIDESIRRGETQEFPVDPGNGGKEA